MVEYRTKKDSSPESRGPWMFLAVFLAVFFLIAVFLFAIDFVPESKGDRNADHEGQVQTAAADTNRIVEEPTRVVIPSVKIDTPVMNPTSTDVETLDQALLSGAARYPDSGLLGSDTGMFLFAHQSRLPVVHNKAFKAFAGLEQARQGDEIIVYSATAQYHYRVLTVEHASIDDAWIEFTPGDTTLTLSTCDSFGKKTDRYVVTAEFVSREPII